MLKYSVIGGSFAPFKIKALLQRKVGDVFGGQIKTYVLENKNNSDLLGIPNIR